MEKQDFQKIVFTGPESTGKTTLAQWLAGVLGLDFCPEFSRYYVGHLGRQYQKTDLPLIARGQVAWEDWHLENRKIAPNNTPFLIFDTDLTVLHVWHLYKYNSINEFILTKLNERKATLYFLTAPEQVSWEDDPLRENPNDREVLFDMYENLLKEIGANYTVLDGDLEERKAQVMAALDFL